MNPNQRPPNMPARNPWLADSVYPTTHFNPAATDSIAHAGPTRGRQLTAADVKTVPGIYTRSPTVKREGDATILIASGIDGIRKIDATGASFDLMSFLPYPGLEALAEQATPEALEGALSETDAAVSAKDEARILALSKNMADLGFSRPHLANGVYNVIDKDGFHYAPFAGLKIIKTTDDNDRQTPLRIVKIKNLADELPAELARTVTSLRGFGLTYEGDIAAAAEGALFLLDRELHVKGILRFPGEVVENGICMDEDAVYVVTSRRMLKIIWTGSKLSYDEADGGWESPYNTTTSELASAVGVSRGSGGSGTTPTLMGFGDDPDKLVIIADGDPRGTNLVAFWRDKIPSGIKQKLGTKSRRIADQVRIDVSRGMIEPSPNVLGYGALFLNCTYPRPVPDIWGNAMASGVTRPAPTGAQRFTWNTRRKAFDKVWLNLEIDNSDVVVPVVSAITGMVYLASKRNGHYEYVAMDWDTGELKARWPFPDESRKWNAYGGCNVVLEGGDFLLGGLFALKRVSIGEGAMRDAPA